MFERGKDVALLKLARAREKNEADVSVAELVDFINKSCDLYTTSSCSGRIVAAQAGIDNKKTSFEFLGKWHSTVFCKDVKLAVSKYGEGILWFKFEPMILHVCCKSIDSASRFLDVVYHNGFKRSGIYQVEGKIMVEVYGTDGFSVPIGFEGCVFVDNSYLEFLVDFANIRLKRNLKKVKRLERIFEKF